MDIVCGIAKESLVALPIAQRYCPWKDPKITAGSSIFSGCLFIILMMEFSSETLTNRILHVILHCARR